MLSWMSFSGFTKCNVHCLSTEEFKASSCVLQSNSRLFIFFTAGKIFVPKQKPVQSYTEEKFSLDPELEEALTSATDTELGDLAG